MHHYYIIKVAPSRDQIISEMDALVEDPCEAPMRRKMMLLYSYCFDTEHGFELTALSSPFLKFKCLFGDVSFPGALSYGGLLSSRKASPTHGTENLKDDRGFALCLSK